MINSPPENGRCSIDPPNGTTSSQFTVSCSNWTDDDQIKDYSLLADRTLIAFSSTPIFNVYLPAGVELQLVISIRDRRDCVAEWTNLSSVFVRSDINLDEFTTNPFVRLLSSANQNLVGQVLGSLFHHLNQLNTENLRQATSSEFVLLDRSIFALLDSLRWSFSDQCFCFLVGNGSTARRGSLQCPSEGRVASRWIRFPRR